MRINIAAFKAGWRQACEERQIDPASGPTTYQVAMYKAEAAEAEKWRQASERRWATAEGLARLKNWGLDPTPDPSPKYQGGEEEENLLADWCVYRSSTEKEALAHVKNEARRVLHPDEPAAGHDVTFIAEGNWAALVLHEVLQELKAEDGGGREVPLREIHARNRMKLEWIELYDGKAPEISVLVPAGE